jgi:uncharacterized protein (TIGR03435 family)
MREVLPVVLWLAGVASCDAQTEGAPTQELAFEVASVKPNSTLDQNVSINRTQGGGLDAVNVSVRMLITFAYRIRDQQLSGAPGWLDTDRYDIHAKTPVGEPAATDFFDTTAAERVRLRTRALLTDRFKLVLRSETREMPVYVLTLAKNGPKPALKRWQPGDEPGPQNIGRVNSFTAKKVSMRAFAEGYLSTRMDRVVLDQTGLSGDFNFKLEFVPDQAGRGATDLTGPSFLDAFGEQLGLRMEPRKSPVKVLVIDHVERPTAN